MNYGSARLGIDILLVLGSAVLLLCILMSVAKLRTVRRHLRRDIILMELTPPPAPHNTLLATEEFFSVLSRILSLRTWRELVSGATPTLALEVVSTKREGIRYLVRMSRFDEPVFLHNLAAFAPTVTARKVMDYMLPDTSSLTSRVMTLRQTGSKRYALNHSHSETANDPIAYLTNAMSGLADDELMGLQVILAPYSNWLSVKEANSPEAVALYSNVPADIVAATTYKNHQPQFQTTIRIFMHTSSAEHARQRIKAIRGALATYAYEGYQSLTPRLELSGWARRYHLFAVRTRLPAIFHRHACVLSTSELAAVYHFPYATAMSTEDLSIERSTLLPVPLSVKNQTDLDVLLGDNSYRGRTTPIGLTAEERQRHMYVVGGTGNGKSTLLHYAVIQDIRAGKGVAVLDPHGDLVSSLLEYIPDDRIDDVIYFNPSDIRYPIGLNLLELTPGLDADDLLQEKDMVTESIVSMFRKIFSTNDTSGHRIEYVLRNAVQTALTLEGATLFTVYNLLNDPAYRKRVIGSLENPELRLFWREFTRAGSFQQVSMAAGITAKIGRFLFSAAARRILEQPNSTIHFDSLMQDGKILLCNVSKGQLGEDTSELFGIMVLAKLQLATLRRANRPATDRPPFYVYVDEFQNFATPSFVQLLSEARKYGLFLTMAEQSTSQQSDPRMIDIIFANVGTIVCFRTSSQRDESLLQPLLSPFVAPGSISTLPAYNFYVRITAAVSIPPFSGRTVRMDQPGDPVQARFVIQASRMQYGRPPEPILELPRGAVPSPLSVVKPLGKGST
jgi:hypothetical protein